MKKLTLSDIPASLRGLNWLEATEENLKEHKGDHALIAKVFNGSYRIRSVYINYLACGLMLFDNDSPGGYDFLEVDYFVPII